VAHVKEFLDSARSYVPLAVPLLVLALLIGIESCKLRA
jgi:hypothetical protein